MLGTRFKLFSAVAKEVTIWILPGLAIRPEEKLALRKKNTVELTVSDSSQHQIFSGRV